MTSPRRYTSRKLPKLTKVIRNCLSRISQIMRQLPTRYFQNSPNWLPFKKEKPGGYASELSISDLKRLSQKGFQSVSLLQLADMSFARALASSFLRRQESSGTLVPSGWEGRSRALFSVKSTRPAAPEQHRDKRHLRGNDELDGWVDAQST
ncbi:hypothetical protein [Undibacterium sp. CCC3.4]|uniref:hypothetical protein n=1 Tax=Undibacterium sp. CCC3.4 TaxID=3048609 RepID=UPI002AC8D202|nr:hypothetical protein [Undibacterium sp. CCC3.4]WPX43151.1 hypothetical protein RHM61_17490 [Undibacterium sp. CCC3.4]